MTRQPVAVWLRRNLFRTPIDAVVTVLATIVSAWVLYKTVNFVFNTGRWDIIRVNLELTMIGRFPEVHVLRLSVTVIALSAWAGCIAGIVHARQVRAGRSEPERTRFSLARVTDLAERFWIPVILVLLLLALTETAGPWITAGLALVAGVIGRLIGPLIGVSSPTWRGPGTTGCRRG